MEKEETKKKNWDSSEAPLPIHLEIAFPKAFIDAHSDLNALYAYCVRRSKELGVFGCGMPHPDYAYCEGVGVSFENNGVFILGVLYDYFRRIEREQEAKKELNKIEPKQD